MDYHHRAITSNNKICKKGKEGMGGEHWQKWDCGLTVRVRLHSFGKGDWRAKWKSGCSHVVNHGRRGVLTYFPLFFRHSLHAFFGALTHATIFK